MFGTVEDLQRCLEEDIGWSEDCARCWAAEDICVQKSSVALSFFNRK
jgi:hypothetical protein